MLKNTIQQQFEHIAQQVPYQEICYRGVKLSIKRLDLIHAQISGNKFFKLKYNLIQAKTLGYHGILTFGGAYSNHIAATAYATQLFGLQSIGMIRGQELAQQALNPTLMQAQHMGMQLHFLSRAQYRNKDQADFLRQLQQDYAGFYLLPEGGTNDLAILGCQEILTTDDLHNFKTICCAVGTGGTLAGLIEASQPQQHILGFSALKGDFLSQNLHQMSSKSHWQITDAYCCGGYAKTTTALLDFIQQFEADYHIPLEHIYTGKMFMGIFDLIEQGQLSNDDQILVIHSGGLQGRSTQLKSL